MLPIALLTGPMDIAIVAVVVLVLFGGQKLAGMGKSLGEGIREFKKATEDDEKPALPPAAKDEEKPAPLPAAKDEEK